MAQKHPLSLDETSTAKAIQEVLTAEIQARQAVLDCQKEAEKILDHARQKAAKITSKADLKISDIQKEYSKKIRKQEAILNLDNQRSTAFDLKSSHYETLLEQSVSELAAWITGGEQ